MFSILYTSNQIYQSEFYSYTAYFQGSKPEKLRILTGALICPLIVFVISYLYLPGILANFAMSTNIEMMKDRALIEQVVCFQKF